MRLVGESRVGQRCPACRAAGLQQMTFAVKNGDCAQMRRCSGCEWRGWFRNGDQVALLDVLALVREEGLPHAPRPQRRAG